MNTMPPKILFLTLLILFTSCVKEVDFDQVNDWSIQPKYVASLAYFNFNQHQFLDALGNEIHIISDKSPAPLASGTFTKDYLTKVEFQYKVSNTFNRTMVITLQFYNANNQLTYQFIPITIPPNTQNRIYTEVITAPNLSNFLNSHWVAMQVILVPNPSVIINPTVPKNLNVQISGQFYFNIQN
ncbi:MAG: hypothetical protein Q7U08_09315 [Flavobacteriaceae bacterium]|nr:hypothetical protein [Flavobacteriaceae bacterium]